MIMQLFMYRQERMAGVAVAEVCQLRALRSAKIREALDHFADPAARIQEALLDDCAFECIDLLFQGLWPPRVQVLV